MSWTCAYCKACSGPIGNVEETKQMITDWVVCHLGRSYHKKCLGASLRVQRINLQIPLRQMAKIVGVSAPHLRDMERGFRGINKRISKEYSDHLIKVQMDTKS